MHELSQYRHIHFIGIGGAGMSAIAQILLARGHAVSGSDRAAGPTTERLSSLGARVFIGHDPAQLAGADLVVASAAIREDNPELRATRQRGLPLWHRARALAELMHAGRSVAVSGTHGKTSTTSMLGLMLECAGMDPTVLIGGHLSHFGGNARAGAGQWTIAEADESDASFLEMAPDRIIITNIEIDHHDHYRDHAHVVETFGAFIDRLTEGGKVIACHDDPAVRALVGGRRETVLRYGLVGEDTPDAEVAELDLAGALLDGAVTQPGLPALNGRGGFHVRGPRFVPIWRGQRLAPIHLAVPGRHNALNALGALACGLDIGADYAALHEGLQRFAGANRRFQIKGEAAGLIVIDDYAHHPSELTATLTAARTQLRRAEFKRLVAVFQPHRFSRTQHLARELGQALATADLALVTDVYAAGEPPIEGVDGALVARAAAQAGNAEAHFLGSLEDARQWLLPRLCEGDVVLTLGAGNIHTLGEALLADLANGPTAESR